MADEYLTLLAERGSQLLSQGKPGDYPLPPSRGPAIAARQPEPALPIADLLPLKDSSLAVAPTLVSLSQPPRRNDAPPAVAPVRDVAANNPVSDAFAAHGVGACHSEGGARRIGCPG